MNGKKIVAILMCMLLLAVVPIAAGATQEKETQTTEMGGTLIRGTITSPKFINGGQDIEFRAVYVHYMTHGIGERQYGVCGLFKRVNLPNDFIGFLGNHYVLAWFNGELEIV